MSTAILALVQAQVRNWTFRSHGKQLAMVIAAQCQSRRCVLVDRPSYKNLDPIRHQSSESDESGDSLTETVMEKLQWFASVQSLVTLTADLNTWQKCHGFSAVWIEVFVEIRLIWPRKMPKNRPKRQFEHFKSEHLRSQVTPGEHLVEIVQSMPLPRHAIQGRLLEILSQYFGSLGSLIPSSETTVATTVKCANWIIPLGTVSMRRCFIVMAVRGDHVPDIAELESYNDKLHGVSLVPALFLH
ncbi:hypothetical protein B0H11DRAFT_1938742 [Mycena galericulata]|nr:hypothetical protein B0H11DRAFT_1938742 [Mycena galericulata]